MDIRSTMACRAGRGEKGDSIRLWIALIHGRGCEGALLDPRFKRSGHVPQPGAQG